MKKSLLAVAAIGAFASAAQAQSSVTVYGILDVGFISTNNRIANNTLTGNTVTNATTSQVGQNAESTSRLGFKGMEDLGGGLSAFFTIETAIAPQTQNAIQSNVSTSNRQTFVGLKKNGIGEFAIGTQYTTIHNAAAATDPGQLNNMQGNVIYDKAGFATATNGSAVAGQTTSAAATWAFSGNQDNTSYTVRSNNMLSVKSHTFAGITGNAFYTMNNNNTNQTTSTTNGTTTITGGTTNNNGFGLGANYAWNKLLVTANYQQFTDKGPSTITAGVYSAATGPIAGGFGGTSVYGTNAKDNQQYYAATYDFGILKAFAQYVNRKSLDINNPNNYVARTAQQIGVRSYITPTIETWASAGTGKLTVSSAATGTNYLVNNAAGAGSNSTNFSGYQLGTNYWLSKRTNLYAIYGNQSTNNQVFKAGTNATSSNSSAYALGVRHTF
jgi:predicted porin